MDNAITLWQAIVGVGIIEVLNWLITFRANFRKANTSADSDQFHFLKETVEFLQKQLKEKEERFVEQTELKRADQRRIFALQEEICSLKLEAAKFRCEDLGCMYRHPPNAFTPPRKDISKEDYFLLRGEESETIGEKPEISLSVK